VTFIDIPENLVFPKGLIKRSASVFAFFLDLPENLVFSKRLIKRSAGVSPA
jgi:hypothetical protein